MIKSSFKWESVRMMNVGGGVWVGLGGRYTVEKVTLMVGKVPRVSSDD